MQDEVESTLYTYWQLVESPSVPVIGSVKAVFLTICDNNSSCVDGVVSTNTNITPQEMLDAQQAAVVKFRSEWCQSIMANAVNGDEFCDKPADKNLTAVGLEDETVEFCKAPVLNVEGEPIE